MNSIKDRDDFKPVSSPVRGEGFSGAPPTGSAETTVREAVRHYVGQGWAPVPIAAREKRPLHPDWPNQRIGPEQVDASFPRDDMNVGVVLGEASGRLMDVDLDCPEACFCALRLLPDTLTFGRASAPLSHYLYQVYDGELSTAQFQDPGSQDGTVPPGMLVELRGNRAQTVLPPSRHKDTGEEIRFTDPAAVAYRIGRAELHARVALVAVTALLARRWPGAASYRDELALAVVGTLLRCGCPVELAETVIRAVAEFAGDEEADARVAKVRRTKERLDRGEKVAGRRKLAEYLGEAVPRKIAEWLGVRDDRDDAEAALRKLNERHAVVPEGGKTLVYNEEYDPVRRRPFLTASSFPDFERRYSHVAVTVGGRRVPLGKAWLHWPGRREYRGIVFAPEAEHDGYLNLWRGFGVEERQGDWSLMQRHIREVVADGNEAHAEYILNWLAHAVQRPGELPEVALVLRGKRGTGKGILANAMVALFGQHGLQVSQARHVTGNFNAHMRDCALLYVNEGHWAGDKQGEGVLKALITEPELVIERKGVDLQVARNYLHVMVTSNVDWIVPAGMEERRFAVFDVSDAHMQDTAYFKAIADELANGGLEAMLYDLRRRDIRGFDPRRYPRTPALLEQKLASLHPVDRWWYDCLYQGQLICYDYGEDVNETWADAGVEVITDALYDDYQRHCRAVGVKFGQSREELGRRLRKLLPEGFPQRGRIRRVKEYFDNHGQTVKLGSLVATYRLPDLATCRAYFAAELGHEIDWGDEAVAPPEPPRPVEDDEDVPF